MAIIGNRLLLIIKLGDQRSPVNDNLTVKNGMPVLLWDESVRGAYVCDNEKRIFWVIEVSRSYQTDLENYTVPLFDANGDDVRARTGTFELDELISKFGDPSLKSRLFGKTHLVEVISATGMNDPGIRDLLYPTKVIDYTKRLPIRDVNAIDSGSHTIKSGGDYTTLTTFAADFATLIANIEGIIGGALTEPAQNKFITDAAGFKLTLSSDTDHGGDVTQAHKVTVNGNNNGLVYQMSNAGSLDWNGWYLYRGATSSFSNRRLCSVWRGGVVPEVYNMFIDGGGFANHTGLEFTQDGNTKIYNNVVWDCANEGYDLVAGSGTPVIDNNIAYNNGGIGFQLANKTCLVENNASLSNGTGFTSKTNGTGKNNLATDATASSGWTTESDNLDSKLIGDNVINETDTDPEFLKPKSGSDMAGSGIVPTTPTTDNAGVTYATPFPIGPSMLPVSGPPLGSLCLTGVGR